MIELIPFGTAAARAWIQENGRLLITGSRTWDAKRAGMVAAALRYGSSDPLLGILIHGDAGGADRLLSGALVAAGLVLEENVRARPADWSKGRGAGYARNAEMVSEIRGLGGMVLACWDGESRGTKHTIECARKAGLLTVVITPVRHSRMVNLSWWRAA